MAKQTGLLTIQGSIDGLTFYKCNGEWRVKEKSSIPRSTILNSPRFVRTRENMSEFGHAAKAARIFRNAFMSAVHHVKDSTLCNRVQSEMNKVIKSDCTSPRGERNVSDGNICLLKSFEFNKHNALSNVIMCDFSAQFDRVAGIATGIVNGLTPCRQLRHPEGCTHFRLFTAAALLDFGSGTSEGAVSYSDKIPLDSNEVASPVLQVELSSNSYHPVAVVMGIEFFRAMNGTLHLSYQGAAAQVVKVEKA